MKSLQTLSILLLNNKVWESSQTQKLSIAFSTVVRQCFPFRCHISLQCAQFSTLWIPGPLNINCILTE